MNIIICGATKTGAHAAEIFASNSDNITVVDTNLAALETLSENLDIAILNGKPAAASVLKLAGACDADAVIAAGAAWRASVARLRCPPALGRPSPPGVLGQG